MTGQVHNGDFDNNGPSGAAVDMNTRLPVDDNGNRKQSISEVLHQIMTITDQSLDEAQARYDFLTSLKNWVLYFLTKYATIVILSFARNFYFLSF